MTRQQYAMRGIVADDVIPPGKPVSGSTVAQSIRDLPWVPILAGIAVGWYARGRR